MVDALIQVVITLQQPTLAWASAIDTDTMHTSPPEGTCSTVSTHLTPCLLLPLCFVLLISCVACLDVGFCCKRCWIQQIL